MTYAHIVKVAQRAHGPRPTKRARVSGKAESTIDHSKAAARLNTAYRKFAKLPKVMTYDEIDGEWLAEYMSELSQFCCTRIFPYNFDDDVQPPPGSTTNKCATAKTLQGYLGKILQDIREQCPDHPDFHKLRMRPTTLS